MSAFRSFAATPAIRSAEVDSTKVMIDRVKNRFGVCPKRLIGDTAYGTAEMLAWMVEEKAIEPHVPLWEMGERDDGTFSRSDFAFDATPNTLTCPGGKRLQQYRYPRNFQRSGVTKANTRIYRASKFDWGRACSSRNAVLVNPCAKLSEACTKPHATWPDASEIRPNICGHVATGRKSRCCSPI